MLQLKSNVRDRLRMIWLIIVLPLINSCHFEHQKLPSITIPLNKPYAEWTLSHTDYSGNPYDVIASATFSHKKTGTRKRSLMFYDDRDHLWKFRFTGTRKGIWKIKTEGPGNLGGLKGTIKVTESDTRYPGFLTGKGSAWIWEGTGEEFVPQLVMTGGPEEYWVDNQVDTAKIDQTIREFIEETGFTGFHIPGGGGWWYHIDDKNTRNSLNKPIGSQNPDPRSFQVYEEFLTRCYEAGAATHIWMWGSDAWGTSGPAGIGGCMSDTDRRTIRYIAGRLGPIPGWSMGYGYDLYVWIGADDLQTWYDFFKANLGGWEHLLGGRADSIDIEIDEENFRPWRENRSGLKHRPVSLTYWTGDYSGHMDFRVAYPWYVKNLLSADIPQLQEDRFRIRSMERRFQHKDYTSRMVVRGLWHSTVCGGVGNIWGNLLPHMENDLGSEPFNNMATGTIRGIRDTVDIKDEIKTYSIFWFEKNRFSADLVRDNRLMENITGEEVLYDRNKNPINVCLRNEDHSKYVFYAEKAESVQMDLSHCEKDLDAVAVDTRKPYKEMVIGRLYPVLFTWQAPYKSDWAIAVGVFD